MNCHLLDFVLQHSNILVMNSEEKNKLFLGALFFYFPRYSRQFPLSSFLVICQHSTATCFCFENLKPCLFWWHEQLCILWCDFWPWQVMTVDTQKLSTYWLTSNQKYVVVWIQNIFKKKQRSKLVSLLINYFTYVALSEKPSFDIQYNWSSKSLNRVTTSLP